MMQTRTRLKTILALLAFVGFAGASSADDSIVLNARKRIQVEENVDRWHSVATPIDWKPRNGRRGLRHVG